MNEKIIKWWNNLSEEDKIWIMMKYGYENPFDPKRVKNEEIEQIFELETNN